MWRGDVHRFYRALRQDHPSPPPGPCRRLDHVREIAAYYEQMTQTERLLLLAWAKKEESGIGVIPLALSAVPFFGLLLGSRVQEPLSTVSIWYVYVLWVVFGLLLVGGLYLHQRQKAYTMLHVVLLEQAIKRGEAEAKRAEALQAGAGWARSSQVGAEASAVEPFEVDSSDAGASDTDASEADASDAYQSDATKPRHRSPIPEEAATDPVSIFTSPPTRDRH